MRGHRIELVSKLTDKQRADFMRTLTNPPRKTDPEIAAGLVAHACLGSPVKGAYGKLPRAEREFIDGVQGHRGIGHKLMESA